MNKGELANRINMDFPRLEIDRNFMDNSTTIPKLGYDNSLRVAIRRVMASKEYEQYR